MARPVGKTVSTYYKTGAKVVEKVPVLKEVAPLARDASRAALSKSGKIGAAAGAAVGVYGRRVYGPDNGPGSHAEPCSATMAARPPRKSRAPRIGSRLNTMTSDATCVEPVVLSWPLDQSPGADSLANCCGVTKTGRLVPGDVETAVKRTARPQPWGRGKGRPARPAFGNPAVQRAEYR